MQVYGSYKYPRTDIHRLRPGKIIQQATGFTPNILSSPDTGESRRVGPFHMKPATAIRSARHLPAMRAAFMSSPCNLDQEPPSPIKVFTYAEIFVLPDCVGNELVPLDSVRKRGIGFADMLSPLIASRQWTSQGFAIPFSG